MRKIAKLLLIIIFLSILWSNEIYGANPQDLILGLINTVKSLQLHSGIENSLLAKLEAAQKGLRSTNPNHYKNSVKPLEAFKNEVRAQRGKHIPEAGANALLAQADNLIRIIPGITSQNIGTGGGSLLITDKTSEIYGTSVSVPPGALPTATLITVVQEPNPPPMPTNLISPSPAVTFGPEGTNFLNPVTIAIPYKEQPGINENDLKLFTFDKITDTWIEVPINSRDTINNILYAQVTHFSTFQVGGQPSEVDPDAPHFEFVVVWSQTSSFGNELFLAASVIDRNGSVPGTIESLTVQGPENFFYKFNYLDYYFDIPLGKGIYRATLPLTTPPKSGDYTFIVKDVEGKETSRTKTLTVIPIPIVSKYTLNPPDRADSGTVTTTPMLTWFPVFHEKTVYYRIFIENWNRTHIYRSKRFTGNQFHVSNDPSHPNYVPLLENAIYYWRVEAFDDEDGLRASNVSRSDRAIFATGNLSLTNSPIFESPRVWTDNDAGRGQYFLHLGGQLRRGVSGPILTCSEIRNSNFNITVEGPNEQTITIPTGSFPVPGTSPPILSAGCIDLYSYLAIDIQLTDPPNIPTGEYIFKAIDNFRNWVQFGDFFNELKKLPVPVQISPVHNSTLNLTPTFIWEPVEGARTYQINIDRRDGMSWVRVFESPRSPETAYKYGTSDPSLNPNTQYRWRVRAFDGRYFSEIDNRSTSSWREFRVDSNAPYFNFISVWSDTQPTGNNLLLGAYVKDPNGALPYSIESLTVRGPNNYLYSFSSSDYRFDIVVNDWMYKGGSFGLPSLPASGRYIFQVTDTEGKTCIAYKDLVVSPIPIVDMSSFSPVNGSIGVSTTPTLSWLPILDPRLIYYRATIQDLSRKTIYQSIRSIASSVTIPSGILQPGSTYYWQVEAFDNISGIDASNRSGSAWAYFITEFVTDPDAPYFNWVTVWNDSYPHPVGVHNLNLAAFVKDPNGYVDPVNNTIRSLTVSGPNNFSYSFDPSRPFFHFPINDWIYASPLIPGVPENGRYVFQVTDNEGKTGIAYKDLAVNPVPIVDKNSMSPSDGATVSTTPTLSWTPVSDLRTIYYRVRILDSTRTTIYDSPLSTGTNVTIPSGVLNDGSLYYWRVQAFDAPTTIEASNRSNSALAYFTTGVITDTTPPILVSSNPPNGATKVAVTNRTISFTFNEQMGFGFSVTWTNLDSRRISFIGWSPDKKTVTFYHATDLPANTTISWVLNPSTHPLNFRDLAGNPLPSNIYSGSFITAGYPNVPQFSLKWGYWGEEDGQFMFPSAIAVDLHGNVFVVDENNKRVQKFDSNGNFITKWGSPGTGDGQFSFPSYGIAVDSYGNVFVTDTNMRRIQKFDSDGNFIMVFGPYLGFPGGIAIDPNGNVYVTEFLYHRVHKLDANGNVIVSWGGWGSSDGEFLFPTGVAVDSSGYVYVADTNNYRIQKFDSNGNFITKWGNQGAGDGQFYAPEGLGIAVDQNGNIYVADQNNHRIQKFDSNGTFITKWGSEGFGDGQFNHPQGVAIDSNGNIYVVDRFNHRIQKFAFQ